MISENSSSDESENENGLERLFKVPGSDDEQVMDGGTGSAKRYVINYLPITLMQNFWLILLVDTLRQS